MDRNSKCSTPNKEPGFSHSYWKWNNMAGKVDNVLLKIECCEKSYPRIKIWYEV